MKRLNDRETELTDEEMRASDYFDEQLDDGLGIPDAVAATRQRYESLAGHVEQPSEAFWRWLGE